MQSDLDYRGARFYDSDAGRFLSLDPMAAKYLAWSSYNYVFANPIAFVDPDGRSGRPTVDKENKIITIHAQLNFYGEAATQERASDIADAIQGDWNDGSGSVMIDGESYQVRFVITGKKITKAQAFFGKIFGGPENNYINLTNNTGNVSGTGILGGNSGTWRWYNDGIINKEYSHEFGHMLGWYDPAQFQQSRREYGTHDYFGYSTSATPDSRDAPGIMSPSDTKQSAKNKHRRHDFNDIYYQNGSLDRPLRCVTPNDINRIGLNLTNPTTPITTAKLVRHPRYVTPGGKSLINYIKEQTRNQ